MKHPGVNKREKLRSVPVVRLVRRSTALLVGFAFCIATAFVTLFGTLAVAITEPDYLELPIHYTMRLLKLVSGVL